MQILSNKEKEREKRELAQQFKVLLLLGTCVVFMITSFLLLYINNISFWITFLVLESILTIWLWLYCFRRHISLNRDTLSKLRRDYNMRRCGGEAMVQRASKLLVKAVMADDISSTRQLIKFTADINYIYSEDDNKPSILHIAVMCRAYDIIGYLLSNGADYYAEDNRGLTAVETAIDSDLNSEDKADMIKIVELILNSGYNVNYIGSKGVSLLKRAILRANTDILRLLIARGAVGKDVKIKDYAWVGETEPIKQMIANGADINEITIEDNYEATALHIGAYYGYPDIVKLLLEAGADISIRARLDMECEGDYTPLEIVEELLTCDDLEDKQDYIMVAKYLRDAN